MANSQASEIIQHLHRVLRDGAGLTDDQLLGDYISRRDEAAIAALVSRHGPMVWGVCSRVLDNHHDAEDAFQATFLVLIRKAASIATRELVANWLYGVARQTALKARATHARRKARERQVTEMPEPAATPTEPFRDVQPVLDEELSRLPEPYRCVIVLCDLEGKTRKEVAGVLRCPEGTVASRLMRARALLAKRLTQRGVEVSGVTLASVLAQQPVTASVPSSVIDSTIKAATLFAAGKAAMGAVSAPVAALAEGVMTAMVFTKLKAAIAVLLVLGFLAAGATIFDGNAAKGQDEKSTAEKPAPILNVRSEESRVSASPKSDEPVDTAENVFRKAERKIREADSLLIAFEGVLKNHEAATEKVEATESEMKYRGTTHLARGNKSRLETTAESKVKLNEGEWGSATSSVVSISNGTKTKMVTIAGDQKPKSSEVDTPRNANNSIAVIASRAGMMFANSATGETLVKMEERCKVANFSFGKKEKIGGRPVQRINYTLTLVSERGRGSQTDKGLISDTIDAAVWLDVETNLPVKRVLKREAFDSFEMVETYTIRLNAPVGADKFELPADKHPATNKPVEPAAKQGKEKEPSTAWGKESGGLQLGLTLVPADKTVYRHGEKLIFEVKVRNASKDPITISYGLPESKPDVSDAKGGQVAVLMPPFLGAYVVPTVKSLKPGETTTLFRREVAVEGSSAGKGDSKRIVGEPTIQVLAGKYRIAFSESLRSNLFLSTGVVEFEVAAEKSKRTEASIMSKLKSSLENELRDLKTPPAFEVVNGSLIVRYKTREYLVYPPNKAGRLAREPEKREGPDDDGILLKVYLQPKGEVNQAVTPCTIQETYWSTDLDVAPIGGTDHQFYFAISYRGLTEKELIKRIRSALGQCGE